MSCTLERRVADPVMLVLRRGEEKSDGKMKGG
jgi:hypothetical protein